jgi:hypothetical protein
MSSSGTRARIPNKVQWALQDILAKCDEARDDWQLALKIAEKQMDVTLVALLARLRDGLAEIERKASDALNGEYRE